MGWKNSKYLKLEEKVNKKLSNADTYGMQINEIEKITSDVLPYYQLKVVNHILNINPL